MEAPRLFLRVRDVSHCLLGPHQNEGRAETLESIREATVVAKPHQNEEVITVVFL